MVYRPLPTIDGDMRLLGLEERGEVLRDTYGVPHVYTQNAHDLFFLQGYVTAQDRLFQMDLYRRAAEGRLAEVLGEPGLESDRLLRTIGLARAAQLDLSAASPEVRAIMEAYADGVNKFLQQHGDTLPLEFLILGYAPERWTPLDSFAVSKLQLYDAAGNYTQELLRANIATRLGPESLATLLPDPTTRTAAPYDERAWSQVAPYLSADGGSPGVAALRALLPGAGEGLGSNCWALAGSRTKSGKPLLAGDPHLAVRNPAIWYEVGLQGGGFSLVGFSFAGIPGIVIGHNDRIAWSFAYAYADVQDLFVERQDPTDFRRYEFQGRFEPATVVREEITVKGRTDPVLLDVTITRHGPIVTPTLKNQNAQLALRWNALDATSTNEAVLAIARARDWSSFRQAAGSFVGAALSACYADVDGHVGYLLLGRLPDRKGDGKTPVPGWTGEYDWRGLRTADANPFLLDPADGVVVNANNRPVNSPDSVGWDGEWDPGFRWAYLSSALAPMRDADQARFAALQTEFTSLPVARFREALLGASPASRLARDARELVRSWDGALGADSSAAAVYEAWLVRMTERTFKDKLGQTLYDDYLANGRATFALYDLVATPSSPWFVEIGDPGVRGRDALSTRAIEDAVKDLTAKLGSDPAKWRWGDLHTISFEHPLSAAKPLDLLLTIGPVRRGGDGYSPNNGAYSLSKPFAIRTQASERMIADLSDLDRSVSVIPTGESGQPFSRHWNDQLPLWANGGYKPMAIARDRLGTLEGRLVLRAR